MNECKNMAWKMWGNNRGHYASLAGKKVNQMECRAKWRKKDNAQMLVVIFGTNEALNQHKNNTCSIVIRNGCVFFLLVYSMSHTHTLFNGGISVNNVGMFMFSAYNYVDIIVVLFITALFNFFFAPLQP